MKKIILFCGLLVTSTILPVVVGSNVNVSRETSRSFPAADSDNNILGFAWLGEGFVLEDSTTTCSFDSVFPVAGVVNLNGGTLKLNKDLNFSFQVSLEGLGTIRGYGNAINFPPSVTDLPATTNVFENVRVYMSSDITLNSTLKFQGICTLNGNGNDLILGPEASIIVDTGSTVFFENVNVKNISGTNVSCTDDTGKLNLETVRWIQSGDYQFTQGALRFKNDVTIEGSSLFAYESTQTSTILVDSALIWDTNTTFSYDTALPSLLEFVDNSSIMALHNNATVHATLNGLNLTKGSLVTLGQVNFESEIATYEDPELGTVTIDNGISLGDGENSDNDMASVVSAGSNLRIMQGSFNYRNINGSSWAMENSSSSMFINTDAALKLYKTLNIGSSVATFANNAILGRASGADLIGSINAQGTIIFVSL